jgi:signal transduction histidine kinase
MESNQMEYLKILEENSNRIGELIKDLLIVSQIESGKLPQKKEEFSLEDLTLEIIKEFSSLAQKNGVQINHSFGAKLPLISANKYQIRQVIENLLDNAIRYSREKGVVEIKIERKGKKVYFEVKDNGVGIPKEEQKYIFQKFFRAKNIKRYQTIGTGLGLYISKALVERSGGKIGFFSQEGKGSTFWFTLPIK